MSTAQVSFEADNNADGTADTYIQSVTPQGNEFLVNTTTANDQTLPSVAMDGSGNFIVAWQSQGQPMSFFNNIEAQRFDSSGNRVGGEFMVNSVDDTTTNFIPYVGMASDGTFAITWSNTSTPNYDYGGGITSTVYAQVYGPAGNVLMPQFAPGGAAFSTVAFDSNDDFVISWEEDASTDNVKGMSTTEDVYAQEYQLYDLTAVPKTTFDPKVIRSTFRLNSANSDPTAADFWSFDQSGAQVALDADGDLTASYTGFGPDVSNDNVVQEEINNIDSTAISYSQETLTFRFPPVNALSDIPSNWFRLSFGPGGTPTADIQFLPTNTTTTASNIASCAEQVVGTEWVEPDNGDTHAGNQPDRGREESDRLPVHGRLQRLLVCLRPRRRIRHSFRWTPAAQLTPRFGGRVGFMRRWAPSLRLRRAAARTWGRRCRYNSRRSDCSPATPMPRCSRSSTPTPACRQRC